MAGIKKAESENFAFLDSVVTMEYYLENQSEDPCSIVSMGPNSFNGNLVFAWKKDFIYADIFNH